MILDQLEKEKLDFKKCTGIGYDNAASMAGVHGGVHRLLQNINGKVKFVSCSNHSLNLCSAYASAVNASAITFFGVIERLYTFFSSSDHWCEDLFSHVKVMMKHWSGNHPLECMLQSYSFNENQISRSELGTWFINLSFRKSSNKRGCTNYFAFKWKLFLHVTFVLQERNSGTNKSHPKETSRTWYWFGCMCNKHGCDQNFLQLKQG